MLAGIQVCLFGRYVKSLCLWREMTGYPLDTGGGNRICTWWRMEARKKHLKGNGGKTRWEGDIWGRCSMQLRGGESKVSLRWNAAGGCRKCPGVLGVGVCVGVWVGVGVCVCARAMLGMSGNFSEQMLRSICSGECQVEAAGLISHQPPCIEGLWSGRGSLPLQTKQFSTLWVIPNYTRQSPCRNPSKHQILLVY